MGKNTHAVETCNACETVALKMAPGDSVDCEECGRTLVRENGEIPNEIHAVSGPVETAPIYAKRDDRMEEEGMETVQASIRNPVGKIPRGSLQKAQELVNSLSEELFLAPGGEVQVGELVYVPRDENEGEIVELRETEFGL